MASLRLIQSTKCACRNFATASPRCPSIIAKTLNGPGLCSSSFYGASFIHTPIIVFMLEEDVDLNENALPWVDGRSCEIGLAETLPLPSVDDASLFLVLSIAARALYYDASAFSRNFCWYSSLAAFKFSSTKKLKCSRLSLLRVSFSTFSSISSDYSLTP